jgi:hypothetical protein
VIFYWTTHVHQKTFVFITWRYNHSSGSKDNLPKYNLGLQTAPIIHYINSIQIKLKKKWNSSIMYRSSFTSNVIYVWRLGKKINPYNVWKSSLYCHTFPSRLVRQKIIELYVTIEHTNILSPCIRTKIFIIFLSSRFKKKMHML